MHLVQKDHDKMLGQINAPLNCAFSTIAPSLVSTRHHFVNTRMIFAEIWRKKIEAMKDNERTRTIKGSTLRPGESSV